VSLEGACSFGGRDEIRGEKTRSIRGEKTRERSESTSHRRRTSEHSEGPSAPPAATVTSEGLVRLEGVLASAASEGPSPPAAHSFGRVGSERATTPPPDERASETSGPKEKARGGTNSPAKRASEYNERRSE
jgi:hypothetical protein